MKTKDELSGVLEKYLMIIYQEEFKEEPVKASVIASLAHVTRATVTRALKTLQEMGYINYSPYATISLTEKGLRYASNVAHKSVVLEEFLVNILNLNPMDSKKYSLQIATGLPLDVFQSLRQFVLFMATKKPFWVNWENEVQEIANRHKLAMRASNLDSSRLSVENENNSKHTNNKNSDW